MPEKGKFPQKPAKPPIFRFKIGQGFSSTAFFRVSLCLTMLLARLFSARLFCATGCSSAVIFGGFRARLRGGFFVEDLAGMVKLLFDFILGPLQSRLAKVDGVGQERASRLDSAAVTSVLKADAFGFEEFT